MNSIWASAFGIALLVLLVPQQANASHKDEILKGKSVQVSPSPSPAPVLPEAIQDTCDLVTNKCHIKDYNLTACVPHIENGSEGPFVIVVNNGESSLELNITYLPANITLEKVKILGDKVNKVNNPPNVGRSSSILLNTGNESCVILMEAIVPQRFFDRYMTPINSTYLLFATALLIGGLWACFRTRERGRHLDGIPYRELEMGCQESVSSMNVETAESWDRSWDDNWDEEKAVEPPRGKYVERRSDNSISIKSSHSNERRND